MRSARRARGGFTLVEMLVVVGILVVLTSLLIVGLRTSVEKAKNQNTKALIGRIKTALESYHADFRDYPPDGYDAERVGEALPHVDGVFVGIPVAGGQPRRLKATASLMYFLCRPLVSLSFRGDASSGDPRNRVYKSVGPYLEELSESNFSRPQATRSDGSVVAFRPDFPWIANDFWDAPGNMRLCEIIDAYGRPLCYDRVRAFDRASPGATNVFFQPDRFQNTGGAATSGKGYGVHPDTVYMENSMPLFDEDEAYRGPDGYAEFVAGLSQVDRVRYHNDPRFVPNYVYVYPTGGSSTGGTSTSQLEPKYIGGYDLWSYGRSYMDPTDDIGSWE